MRRRVFSASFVGLLVLAGCNNGSGGGRQTGGTTSNGGQLSGGSSGGAGGAVGSGGAQSSGGTSASGGTTSAGGAPASGGTTERGGTTGSGGAAVSGGSTGRGGTTASGGATSMGGATGSGGATAAGGAGGGQAGSSGGGQAGSSGGGQAGSGGQTAPAKDAGPAGGGNGGGPADGGLFTSNCGGNPWPTADPTKAGSFKVTADKNVGPLAGATPDPVYGNTQQKFNVYRPTTLGSCHPIILWGNGHGDNPEQNPPLCVYSGTMYCGSYKTILDQLASHGFVVIASLSTIVSQADPATGLLPQLVGMNWIVQQNEDSTSPYYHHLDVSRIGATGHSEGAFATSTIGSDPHIIAIATMAGATATPNLHEPALFLCGGDDAQVPCSTIQTAFDAVKTTPVMLEENPTATHGSWIGSIKDPYQIAVTAWMRVHLMDDTANRSMFYGANCKLCQDTQLKVQRKNMDQ